VVVEVGAMVVPFGQSSTPTGSSSEVVRVKEQGMGWSWLWGERSI
jgi:hypothetical protein